VHEQWGDNLANAVAVDFEILDAVIDASEPR
jgi:hypothetical protein